MTTFLIDFIVNIFETTAMICLLLSFFLFPMRSYLTQMGLTSIVMAQTSYLVREVFHLSSYTPLFMLGWIIILVWLLFRVHFFYALLMSVTGYLSYVAIQMIIIFILQWFIQFDLLTQDFVYQKIVQIVSSLISIAISILLAKKRIGFSFVPDGSAKVPIKGINRSLLSVLIISSVTMSVFGYFVFEGRIQFAVSGISILLIILVIIRLSLWKEHKE